MQSLLLLAVVVIIGLVIFGVVQYFAQLGRRKTLADHYQKTESLFTPAERAFLPILEKALGDQYRVFGKVRLADIIEVHRGLDKSARQSARNKVQSKHVDFVICDAASLAIRAAVELDDKSHARQDRKERDQFVDELSFAVGLPLIHVPVRSGYSLESLRAQLAPILVPEAAIATESRQDSAPVLRQLAQSVEGHCPKCNSALVRKTATRGEHTGKSFLACSAYPACRYMQPIDEGRQ